MAASNSSDSGGSRSRPCGDAARESQARITASVPEFESAPARRRTAWKSAPRRSAHARWPAPKNAANSMPSRAPHSTRSSAVAENRRPVAHAIIDVHVVIDVDDARTLGRASRDGAVLTPIAKVGGDVPTQAASPRVGTCAFCCWSAFWP